MKNMKKEMTNVDISVLVRELKWLEGGRIVKIYQPLPEEFTFKLHKSPQGTIDFVFTLGKRAHITKYPRENPERPSNFAMFLRKYVGNSIIADIRQHNFDRILEFDLSHKENYTLVFEIFGKGNLILLDSSKKIIRPLFPQKWRHRNVISGEIYEYPPSGIDIFSISKEDLKELLNEPIETVRLLARKLNLSGIYAEEVCKIAGLEKNILGEELEDNDIEKLYLSFRNLISKLENPRPVMVIENGNLIDVLPFPLEVYEGKKLVYYESFNQALDDFFTKTEIEILDKKTYDLKENKLAKLYIRLNEQEETLKNLEKVAIKEKKLGDLIYANYHIIENILNMLKEARDKGYSWEDILAAIESSKEKNKELQILKRIDLKTGKIYLDLEDEVEIDLKKTLPENAEVHYKKAKKAKEKIEGAKKAIEETKKLIEYAKKEEVPVEIKMPKEKKVRKKKWYEQYRWFFTSEGFLVIGGKDAKSNEKVVKRHMEPSDRYFHANISGAPHVILKTKGKEPSEQSMKEAAIFAACYSNAWKMGFHGTEVYWVYPDQVSKEAPSGEYIPKGGFMIYGKRNYLSVDLKIAIGRVNDKIIYGPLSSVASKTKNFVVIEPGDTPKNEIAKIIKNRINGDLDEIMQAIPGNSSICDHDG
ncbi:MAG: ribosome rescue protein RqcH [Candidatus Hydrothermarchaeota archaeon]